MKTFFIIMCNLAILAGIVVGRIEYQAEKEAGLPEGSPEAAGAQSTRRAEAGQPVPAPKSRKASSPDRSRRRGGELPPAPDELAAVEKKDNPPPRAPPGSYAPVAKDPSLFRGRIEGLQALFLKQDFSSVAKGAGDLEAETLTGPAAVHEQVARLAAKARIFQKLLGSMSFPTAPSEGASEGAKVNQGAEALLSNGSRITGNLVEERPDRYVFKLPGGGIFCPAKEDVLEMRSIRSEAAAALDWKTLEPKVSKLEHPIDIFIDGVERCYRLGLKPEGLKLLEQLLARPDSDNIPLLFVPEADESTLNDWRLAAGRVSPPSTLELGGPVASSTDGSGSGAQAPEESSLKGPGTDETVLRPKIFGLEDESPASPAAHRAGAGRDSQTTTPTSQATTVTSQATTVTSQATTVTSQATTPASQATTPASQATTPASQATTPASQATTRFPPPAPADPAALIRAAQLVGEAQALYQNAAGKEGREQDLQTARERLERVLQVLEPLPPGDEEVKKIRRRVAQLLSDVSRASPF